MLRSQINALVESVRLEIAAIHDQIRASRDAAKASQKAHEEIPVRLAEISAGLEKLRVPSREKVEADAFQRKAHRQQVLLTWGTWLAFPAAAIYAYIANRQLTQMNLATRASRDAAYAACVSAQISRATLRQVQASTVDTHQAAISSVNQAATAMESEVAHIFIYRTPSIKHDLGTPVIVPVTIKNSGRGPALDLHLQIESSFLAMGKEPDFSYSKKPVSYENVGYVLPDDPLTTFNLPVDEDGKHLAWDTPRVEALGSAKIYLSSYGKISYKDTFGRSHWVQFCFHMERSGTMQPGMFKKCAAYNRLDTTPLESSSTVAAAAALQPNNVLDNIVCVAPKDK
jgi:hypothetical protein